MYEKSGNKWSYWNMYDIDGLGQKNTKTITQYKKSITPEQQQNVQI